MILGHLSNADRMRSRCSPWVTMFKPVQFDRRPGDLEATRGLASVAGVVAQRPPDADHWGVTVFLQQRHSGNMQAVNLTIAEAESLAASLAAIAALCSAPGCVPGERK